MLAARFASNVLHFAARTIARMTLSGWLYIAAFVALLIVNQQGT